LCWYDIISSPSGNTIYTNSILTDGYIYKSTNAGETWSQLTNFGSYFFNNIGLSYDETKIVATSVGSGLVYTSDISNVDIGNLLQPYSSGKQIVSGIYSNKLSYYGISYLSNSWTKLTSSGIGGFFDIGISRTGSTIVSSCDRSLFVSTDFGKSWYISLVTVTPNYAFGACCSIDGQKLAATVFGGYVYTSTNAGVNWLQRLSVRNWRSIRSSSDGTILVTCVLGGYIYTSTDSGLTWIARMTDAVRDWYAADISSD
jgi:photosystem II stability/assembly factor-like uncharacterized protein